VLNLVVLKFHKVLAIGSVFFIVAVMVALPIAQSTTVTGGISSINSQVFLASTNAAIFVYPDTAAGSPRCTTVPAIYSDWVAAGILVGLTVNQQYETLDDNTGSPLFVTGTPNCGPGTSNIPLVPVGGPLVNNIVKYYEQVTSITPVYFSTDGTNDYFKARSSNAILATLSVGQLGGSTDYFVIMAFLDASGNTIYIFYGFAFKGTLASAHELLYQKQQSTLGSNTNSYQVWKWQDTNSDGIVNGPGSGDTYTLIASG